MKTYSINSPANHAQRITDLIKVQAHIKVWLESVVEDAQPIVDGKEHLSDGTENIYYGRHETAKALLFLIKKWEGES